MLHGEETLRCLETFLICEPDRYLLFFLQIIFFYHTGDPSVIMI